jgi:hypothetical protein
MTTTSRVILAIAVGLLGLVGARAQTPGAAVTGGDAAVLEDIVIGSRILADFVVLDRIWNLWKMRVAPAPGK